MIGKRPQIPAYVAGLLVLLFTVPALPGARLAAQTTGSVRGTVTGSAQQPLAAAQVVVAGTLVGGRTNAGGVYTLTGVPVGPQTVRVQMIGYGVISKQVTVTAGQTAVADFQLSEAALTLNEVVVTGTGGEQTRRSQPAQVAVLNTEEMIRAIPMPPWPTCFNRSSRASTSPKARVPPAPRRGFEFAARRPSPCRMIRSFSSTVCASIRASRTARVETAVGVRRAPVARASVG